MSEPLGTRSWEGAGARIDVLSAATRIALRCRPEDTARLVPAFGAEVPLEALRAYAEGGRAALWLGPDEWLLLAEDGAAPELMRALAEAAGDAPLSLVDVSHRQVALRIEGEAATALLAEGCPLDLSDTAFPPGRCTRTLFGKVEITLWRRDASPVFHVEVARSFATHLWKHLAEAGQDL